ncbi:hypothetical protein X777_05961, partial [Ooceraea biroi]
RLRPVRAPEGGEGLSCNVVNLTNVDGQKSERTAACMRKFHDRGRKTLGNLEEWDGGVGGMGAGGGERSTGAPLDSPMVGTVQGRGKGGCECCLARRGGVGRVGADDVALEGAEVGKMTAEPSVRHVLPLRVGLCSRSVLPAGTLPRNQPLCTATSFSRMSMSVAGSALTAGRRDNPSAHGDE